MTEIYYGEILLPSTLHIAVGRECNLWWSTIAVFEEGDRSVYFETKCDIGRNTARAFVICPTKEQIGVHTLTIRSRDLRTRAILDEKTVTVCVCEADNLDAHRNILVIGDSRTWHTVDGEQGKNFRESGNKTTTAELMSLLQNTPGANFTFLGTDASERDAKVKNFAHNGWEYRLALQDLQDVGGVRNYVEKYCGAEAGSVLDYVTVMYGVNDLADWHQNHLDQYERSVAKIEDILSNAKALIDLILQDYPACQILLVLEPSTAANQDGFGYWYGTIADCQVEFEYAMKALRKRVIAEFDNGRYSKNVLLSTAGLWCDRLYGYPYVNRPQSARTDEAVVMRLVNCVHPHDNGYRQIADGYYSSILYAEQNKDK